MSSKTLANILIVGILFSGLLLAGCAQQNSNPQPSAGGGGYQAGGNAQLQGEVSAVPTVDDTSSGMPSIDENPGFNDSYVG